MKLNVLTNYEYHNHPAISKSHLDAVAKSGKQYHAAYVDKILERVESLAFVEGSLAHSMILEPYNTVNEFVVSPDINKRTKTGREQWQQFVDDHKGKQVVTAEMWANCLAMRDAVFSHSEAKKWLCDGLPEQSIFFELMGVKCKCRPDWLRNDGVIVDLKTTNDASPAGFAKSVANFRYHVQDWFYRTGANAKRFIFVAVEKSPPHHVAVYELDEDAVSQGYKIGSKNILTIKDGFNTGFWCGYEGIKTISLPPWAKYAA